MGKTFWKSKSRNWFRILPPGNADGTLQTTIAINMLRIADEQPVMIKRCLEAVVQLAVQGVFKPILGKAFNIADLAAAHEYLEKRKSTGKVAVQW